MRDCISRQAAISAICNACGKIDCDKMDKCEKLQLPPVSCSEFPNNSGTISREAVADAINGIECTRHTTWYEFYQKVMTAVEKLPPAEPKTGKWVDTGSNEEWYAREYRCSECGDTMLGEANFCPNCGCRMDGGEQG